MDDSAIGRAFRAVRFRARHRQVDIATAAGVPRTTLIALERGSLDAVRIADMRAVARSLGMRLDLTVRWQGADLDRLLNAGHAAMHEALARMFADLSDWTAVPEVSFSIFGERGVIDIVAWHPSTKHLLLVELKTTLGDPQELVGTMDRRMRLASRIVADRGWTPAATGAWVVFVDTRTNRRHVERYKGLLRARFPADGRVMRSWLRTPSGPVAALSFWSDVGASALCGVPSLHDASAQQRPSAVSVSHSRRLQTGATDKARGDRSRERHTIAAWRRAMTWLVSLGPHTWQPTAIPAAIGSRGQTSAGAPTWT